MNREQWNEQWARTISEKAWQAQVEQIARGAGWLIYHTHDSRRSNPGFPDLVLVKGPRLIFAELKTHTGRISPDQRRWLDALGAASAEVYVWRPADQDEVLAALTRRVA
jgi:hypothetical protein